MNIPKYRAWHKQLKMMMPVLEINLDPISGGVFVESKDGHYCGCRLDMDLWPWADIELMQYIGINDLDNTPLYNEQGIEIYEGDIVCTNNEQQYDDPVCEHYKGVVFYDDQKAMYRIKQPHDTYTPALSNDAIVNIEVVGNVWELEI